MRVKRERTPFGKMVAKLMVDMDVTMAELAEKTGVSAKYVSQLIYGERTPTLEDCARVVKAAKGAGLELTGEYLEKLIEAATQSVVGHAKDSDDSAWLLSEAWEMVDAGTRNTVTMDMMDAAVKALEKVEEWEPCRIENAAGS